MSLHILRVPFLPPPHSSLSPPSSLPLSLLPLTTQQHNTVTSTYERVPVLHELVRTERRYVANLDLLLNTLLPAMEDTVAARDLRLLFPCQLDLLLDWHKQMLVQLEERQDQNSNHHDTVGDIFRRMCSREGGNVSQYVLYYHITAA